MNRFKNSRSQQRPALREVARRAGISVGTVSNVLNGRARVGMEGAQGGRITLDMLATYGNPAGGAVAMANADHVLGRLQEA